MKLLTYSILLIVLALEVFAQVPYDYIPIGRQARRDREQPHPSDINLNYERLFPVRRAYIE